MIYLMWPDTNGPVYLSFSGILSAANYVLDERIYNYHISTTRFDYTDEADYKFIGSR